eukprot:6188877-Pleurochrysis_carterae.AAC.1
MHFAPISDLRVPEAYRFRCFSRIHLPAFVDDAGAEVCAARDVTASAGGDMAAGHAGWALDSLCKAATRRNFILETCLAHLNPFKLYDGAPGLPSQRIPPRCPAPSCGTVLSDDFIEKERRKMEDMSEQKLTLHLRPYRKLHYGKN